MNGKDETVIKDQLTLLRKDELKSSMRYDVTEGLVIKSM